MIFARYGCGCNQTFEKKADAFCHQHGDSLTRTELAAPPTPPVKTPPAPKKKKSATKGKK